MRLYAVANQLAYFVQREVVPEYRKLLLNYVLSGFGDDGDAISHATHQEMWLRCLDCPEAANDCDECEQMKATREAGKVV